jgi:hypothetical protein
MGPNPTGKNYYMWEWEEGEEWEEWEEWEEGEEGERGRKTIEKLGDIPGEATAIVHYNTFLSL